MARICTAVPTHARMVAVTFLFSVFKSDSLHTVVPVDPGFCCSLGCHACYKSRGVGMSLSFWLLHAPVVINRELQAPSTDTFRSTIGCQSTSVGKSWRATRVLSKRSTSASQDKTTMDTLQSRTLSYINPPPSTSYYKLEGMAATPDIVVPPFLQAK